MKPSKFKVGDRVIVRSKEEIFQTLDDKGQLNGMPFMPTMLKFCGQTFRVSKSAHKSCDTVNSTGMRQIDEAVHLEDLRCDGSTYGGCQAGCLLYWHDDWLLPVEGEKPSNCGDSPKPKIHSEEGLLCTTTSSGTVSEPVFVCQATQHPVYSRHLPGSNFSQYLIDCQTGNTRPAEMVEPMLFMVFNNVITSGLGFGSPLRGLYSIIQKMRGKTPYPWQRARIPKGGRTPSAKLNLQPGEWVRIKPYDEILATLDEDYKNRGMAFHAELAYYCGGTFQVAKRIEKIINEQTGRMMHFKNECLVLYGTDCIGRFTKPLFCPRGGYTYWREIWLERVEDPISSGGLKPCPAAEICKTAATVKSTS